jgi:hypothetical protein
MILPLTFLVYVLTLGKLRTGFVKRSRWRMHRKPRTKLEGR